MMPLTEAQLAAFIAATKGPSGCSINVAQWEPLRVVKLGLGSS